jgi:energy-coupling factor transport system substrate-specific component
MRRLQPARGADRGSALLIALASAVGLAVYLYPFVLPALNGSARQSASTSARTGEAPIVLSLLVVLCLGAILREVDPMRFGEGASKMVALLAALVSIGALSRLIPSFLGATPIFLLVILGGYVFGPAFGFQVGALTLAISAFITGGIGPWVPYQMLGLGWVGMGAGFLPAFREGRSRIALLAVYGVISGMLYGVLLNLWFWPFALPGGEVAAGLSWSPDLGVWETVERYARFYLVTSAVFDLFRALGNVVLIVTLARPLLLTLERYRDRFHWEVWVPEPQPEFP